MSTDVKDIEEVDETAGELVEEEAAEDEDGDENDGEPDEDSEDEAGS